MLTLVVVKMEANLETVIVEAGWVTVTTEPDLVKVEVTTEPDWVKIEAGFVVVINEAGRVVVIKDPDFV